MIKSEKLHLPKQVPDREEADWKVIIVDATEVFVQRPKKQRKWYSGKKKRHTIKFQVAMRYKTGKILSVCSDKGSVQDIQKNIKYLRYIPCFMVDRGARFIGNGFWHVSCGSKLKMIKNELLN